jgi:hypothetical protein
VSRLSPVSSRLSPLRLFIATCCEASHVPERGRATAEYP